MQAVIRKLAETGKTMMIVTHEMDFARTVCNRALYMDEGGIYEEGTPEQIFDDPQREKTRRFVKHLKVLELNAAGRDYDFIGAMTQIRLYCGNNRISPKMANRIQLVFEELVQQELITGRKAACADVTVEYSEAEGKTVVSVLHDGNRLDLDGAEDSLPVRLLKGLVSAMHYAEPDPGTDMNCLVLELREDAADYLRMSLV